MTVFAADDVGFIRERMKQIEADKRLASGLPPTQTMNFCMPATKGLPPWKIPE